MHYLTRHGGPRRSISLISGQTGIFLGHNTGIVLVPEEPTETFCPDTINVYRSTPFVALLEWNPLVPAENYAVRVTNVTANHTVRYEEEDSAAAIPLSPAGTFTLAVSAAVRIKNYTGADVYVETPLKELVQRPITKLGRRGGKEREESRS